MIYQRGATERLGNQKERRVLLHLIARKRKMSPTSREERDDQGGSTRTRKQKEGKREIIEGGDGKKRKDVLRVPARFLPGGL